MIARQLCYMINNNMHGIFHLAAEDTISYKNLYFQLISRLNLKSKIEENFEEKGYFALLSKRYDEFPERLKITNMMVINYLIN